MTGGSWREELFSALQNRGPVAEKGETYGLAAVAMDFGRGSGELRLSGHTGGSG